MAKATTLYEEFAEDLFHESPKGWAELQVMRYGIMARANVNETDALELACKILAADKPIKQEKTKMDEAFEGLDYEQLKEAAQAYKQSKAQAEEQVKANTSELDEQEAAELAKLSGTVRGPNYVTAKNKIQQKYTALRNQQPAEVDRELETVKDDPRALKGLYETRKKQIRRGDLSKLSKLQSEFRNAGLEGI
jgi:exonuclease VII large subunit